MLSISALSAAILSLAIWSSSTAAASASGMSGIVSNDDMLGLRDRKLVGVDGIEEIEDAAPGKGSLNLEEVVTGDDCAEEEESLIG